ncbi:MAG: hypothetical protein K2H85_01625 [Allobaculum sp.]|nr:hypothetical protein [Allobaculum sp.]
MKTNKESSSNIDFNTVINTQELADLLGITSRSVRMLAKDEIIKPCRLKPYKFILKQGVLDYIKYVQKGNSIDAPNKKSKEPSDLQVRKDTAEAELKEAKAAIEKIKLAELEATMHSSEDVEALTIDLVYEVRAALCALPGRLAVDLAQEDRPTVVSALIEDEIRAILDGLSKYEYDRERYKKRMAERIGREFEEEMINGSESTNN